MMIKKIIIAVLIGFALVTSCENLELGNEFLEKPPGSDVTIDTVFNSIEYAERFLWNGYATLPYGMNLNWSNAKNDKLGMDILESLSDLNYSFLAWGGAAELYYSGQYTAATENVSTKTKYHYTRERSWEGIRTGWIFIENSQLIPDASQDFINQLNAEAKILIALHYTDMFRHFGGLPWVNRAFYPSDDTNMPRQTARATLDSIVALIDQAIPYLPWMVEDPENWDGRFTQAAAMGLKARILLFGASPLFNSDQPYLEGQASTDLLTWYGGYDPALWTAAADAAKELIDKLKSEGGYMLVNTGKPRQDFQDAYYKRNNGEVLIGTRVRYQSPGLWDGNYYFYQSADRYGTACPTQEYVDMFGMDNGLPIDDPGSGWDPADPWANRDPRLYETVLVNGDNFQGRTAELWIGGRERKDENFKGTMSGYGLRKFLLDRDNATSFQSVVHWPYLRLPEIYLSYAEALNEVNQGPTAEAYQYVNLVRQRVGLSDLTSDLDQEGFREAVLKERACEFGFEEVRWFDLIRWKQEELFTMTLHGTNTYKNGDGTFTYEEKELPERYWMNNWSPKWYLSAFPPDEVYKGYGLLQNPGWE